MSSRDVGHFQLLVAMATFVPCLWPDEGVACEVSRVCKEAGRRVVNKPLLLTQPLFDTVTRLVLAEREIPGR